MFWRGEDGSLARIVGRAFDDQGTIDRVDREGAFVSSNIKEDLVDAEIGFKNLLRLVERLDRTKGADAKDIGFFALGIELGAGEGVRAEEGLGGAGVAARP